MPGPRRVSPQSLINRQVEASQAETMAVDMSPPGESKATMNERASRMRQSALERYDYPIAPKHGRYDLKGK